MPSETSPNAVGIWDGLQWQEWQTHFITHWNAACDHFLISSGFTITTEWNKPALSSSGTRSSVEPGSSLHGCRHAAWTLLSRLDGTHLLELGAWQYCHGANTFCISSSGRTGRLKSTCRKIRLYRQGRGLLESCQHRESSRCWGQLQHRWLWQPRMLWVGQAYTTPAHTLTEGEVTVPCH
jgi:hypothetical protein